MMTKPHVLNEENQIFQLSSEPVHYILTVQLSNLCQYFGVQEVRDTLNCIQYTGFEPSNGVPQLDRHIDNLILTFGQSEVLSFFDLIWGLDKQAA